MAGKAAKGKRAKTRHSHTKKGGKVTVNKLLQQVPIGAKVDIRIDPSVHAGIPFRRYHGMTGTVIGKQGTSYYVSVSKLGKQMKVLVGPAHITVSRGSGIAEVAVHVVHAHNEDGVREERVAA